MNLATFNEPAAIAPSNLRRSRDDKALDIDAS
jgi:hypothetical protein